MPKNFDNYAADLEKLVEQAREAILAGNDPRMKTTHSGLAAFITDSDDRIDGVSELDDIASHTMRDVTLARLDQSLVKNLSERSADIARLVKTISSQSSANNSAAAALRLERAKALLDAGTTAVDELKKFADIVDTSTPDGKKLAKSLGDAIAAVLSVQKQIVA
jgi:hypothetical protein